MDWESSVKLAGVVIAVAAAVVSFLSSQRASRIQALSLRNNFYAEIRKWAGDCVDSLSEAAALALLDPKKMSSGEYFERRQTLMIKLSSLIDKGRWFFPNFFPDSYGPEKPEAFRGIRPRILDFLVAGYKAVRGLDYREKTAPNIQASETLIDTKRHFVASAQAILQPRDLRDQIARLGRLSKAEAEKMKSFPGQHT